MSDIETTKDKEQIGLHFKIEDNLKQGTRINIANVWYVIAEKYGVSTEAEYCVMFLEKEDE
jgi:hypothetical protein